MFGKDAVGSEPLIRIVCTHCDSSVVMDLTSNTFCENLTIFRRETFSQLVTASLEWEEYEQAFFWDLVKGEGIAFEWYVLSCVSFFFYKSLFLGLFQFCQKLILKRIQEPHIMPL